MRRLLMLMVILLPLAGAGCAREIVFGLRPDAAATVYDLGTKSEHVLLPDSEGHRKLVQWAKNNQTGWQPYLATPPGQGIIVRAAKLNLQFNDESVLLRTPEGVFSKTANPSEYSFLRL